MRMRFVNPEVLLTTDLAQTYRVHPGTVRRWLRSRALGVPIGRRYSQRDPYFIRKDNLRRVLKFGTLYPVREAASILNIHPNTVKRRIKSGKIQAIETPGGHYRVSLSGIRPVPPARREPLVKAMLLPLPDILPPDFYLTRYRIPHVKPPKFRRSFHLSVTISDHGDAFEQTGYLQLRGRRLWLCSVTKDQEYHFLGQPPLKTISRLTPLLDLTESQATYLYAAKWREATMFAQNLIESSCAKVGKSCNIHGTFRGAGRKSKSPKF